MSIPSRPSNQSNGGPIRTSSLIQRPQTSAPRQAQGSSNLGNAIAGAFMGMEMGHVNPGAFGAGGGMVYGNIQGGSNGYPGGYIGGQLPQQAMQQPYPFLSASSPYNNNSQQHAQPRNNLPIRPQQYQGQPYPSFPPSTSPYPQYHNQQQQHQQIHPQSYPQQFQHSTAHLFAPYQNQAPNNNLPPRPNTTNEGYTISAAYIPPPPSTLPLASTSSIPQRPDFASSRGGRGRGRGGRGGAGGNSRPTQSQSRTKHNSPPNSPQKLMTHGVGVGGLPSTSRGTFNCSHGECKYVGGGKRELREHEEDRHLIFETGREPKAWSGGKKDSAGARIEGTSISLDSPEAIAKWIEDRKKRWPSNKVVEEKEALRASRIALGLEQPSTRGARGRGRGARGSRGNISTRGGGRGGSKWGEDSRDSKRTKVESSSSSDTSSDSESSSESDSEDSSDEDEGPPEAGSSKVPVAGMFDVVTPQADGIKLEEGTAEMGMGARLHPSRLFVSTIDEGEGGIAEESVLGEKIQESEKKFQVVCKWWRKGTCASGEDCVYLHSLPANSITQAPPTRALPPRKRPAPPPPAFNPFARSNRDSFSQLAELDIKRSMSEVLQVVDFLKQNDWLRGVEGRVGEIDEEGGVVMVESEMSLEQSQEVGVEETSTAKPMIEMIAGDVEMEETGPIDLQDEESIGELVISGVGSTDLTSSHLVPA